MNARRLAKLFREQARISDEIARALDEDAAEAGEPEAKERRKRGPSRVRKLTDLDMQDARNRLKRLGVAV